MPLGPFDFQGQVTFSSGILKIDIAHFLAQDTKFSGHMVLNLPSRALIADIKGQQLSVADFLIADSATQTDGVSAEVSSVAVAADDGRLIPDMALPMVLLQKHFLPEFADAEITIDLAMVKADPLLFKNVKAKIKADDLGAEIDVDNANWGLGGKISGQFSFKVGKQPEFISDFRVLTTPISTFQSIIPAINRLNGTVNAELKGVTSGQGLRALASNFTGKSSFSLYDGYVHLPDEAGAVLALIAPTILEEGLLILKCVELQSDFTKGVDDSFDGVVLSQALSAYGGGRIDLRQEQLGMRYLLELAVLGAPMGLPLGVEGSFVAPKFDPNFESLISGKVANPVPVPNGKRSACHDEVATKLSGKYEGMPSFFSLDALGNLKGLEGLGSGMGTIQEKLKENLSAGQTDQIEKAGKSLLGGLLGN